ncbi:TIR domain-containing protein [Nostoc sp. UHCC 0251]|uniref:TIR domain-containing protein n=1 Tax=Nostoc sp. UHCC 0251 TaxID=3110240 RepID=UPI002B1F911E|nr:TIR domain-containing protein [Nostoc sp. UHCC 0251]MEA5621813.1 TIR domain-containing protein [Nostoc sp. UHCC 0251]
MSSNINYLPYFRVYIVWHPNFLNGQKLAKYLFGNICGDPEHPFVQGLGIPVHFCSVPFTDETTLPKPINIKECLNSAIFIFVDNNMVVCDNWRTYIEQLCDNEDLKNPYHRIYPVAFTEYFYNLSSKLNKIQFIEGIHGESDVDQQEKLLRNVLHICCRQIKQIKQFEENNFVDNDLTPPVKLFLSYTRHDGREITKKVHEWIDKDQILSTFLDTKDIHSGQNFVQEIEKVLKYCAMLVFQTDAYASRYWCHWEVLTAKKYKIPILIINAIKTGEDRSFPYLGNVPTLIWQESQISLIIRKILLEVLRHQYFPKYVNNLQKFRNIPEEIIVLPFAPELLNLVQYWQENTQREDTLIIYPDPPLGDNEINVLNLVNSNIKAWTPSQPVISIATDDFKKPLSGKVVGISVSNSPDLERLGFSDYHLKRALLEISRHLLAQGASIAYGGDLRPDGFTQDLIEMVKAYNQQENNKPEKKILNFLAWPLHLKADLPWQAQYRNEVSIKVIPLPEDIKQQPFKINDQIFLNPEGKENCYVWMRSLTAMREQMAKQIDARIILGGQVTKYKGVFPGIAEEAALTLSNHKPLFVLGAFGGCAKAVGEALLGATPLVLTWEEQAAQSQTYAETVEFYNQRSRLGSLHSAIDYNALIKTFHDTGLQGMNNKLEESENRALFESEDLDEMIYLILKGLQS